MSSVSCTESIVDIQVTVAGETQSGLNNFTEYTMIDPDDMAPFMGFTEDEVKILATQSGMAFDELKKWGNLGIPLKDVGTKIEKLNKSLE